MLKLAPQILYVVDPQIDVNGGDSMEGQRRAHIEQQLTSVSCQRKSALCALVMHRQPKLQELNGQPSQHEPCYLLGDEIPNLAFSREGKADSFLAASSPLPFSWPPISTRTWTFPFLLFPKGIFHLHFSKKLFIIIYRFISETLQGESFCHPWNCSTKKPALILLITPVSPQILSSCLLLIS